MVHDDRTYLDDEGLEYVSGRVPLEDESESIVPAPLGPGGQLWGAHDLYGGYDAE